MEQIGKNKHLTCDYDRSKNIVLLKFTGIANPDLTKEITQRIIAFGAKNPIRGSFVDLTEMKGTFTKLNEHLIKEYFPKMMEQGLTCEGVVVSNDIFTKFAADSLIKNMGNFTMQTFNDKEKAWNWIIEKLN